jgi:hypothetical protein
MPASALGLRLFELEDGGFGVDTGVEVVEGVLLGRVGVRLVGVLVGEEEAEEETTLLLCCVTVPSWVMTKPLPAAQQPWLFGMLSKHQLPSGHAISGASVPLSSTRLSVCGIHM